VLVGEEVLQVEAVCEAVDVEEAAAAAEAAAAVDHFPCCY